MGWNMYLDHGITCKSGYLGKVCIGQVLDGLDSIRIYSFTMGLHLSHTEYECW
jgi:hypothetical protein